MTPQNNVMTQKVCFSKLKWTNTHTHKKWPFVVPSTLCGHYIFIAMKQSRKDSERSAQQQLRKRRLTLKETELEIWELDSQVVKNMRHTNKVSTDWRENNQAVNDFSGL